MRSKYWLVAVVAMVAVSFTMAADWPQWRGPRRNGMSEETGLLTAWPKEGPKLLWQVNDVGSGYSTPSVVGDEMYLLSNEGLTNESVQARRTKDGSLIWSTRIGEVGNPDQMPAYPGARSTPTVDGAKLFALGSNGDLVCLDRSTGKVQWQKSVRSEFGGKPGKWAYAESPLIDGELLICTPGGEQATIVALNKVTGEVVWKSAVPGGDDAGYASVIIANAADVKQYVQFLAKGIVGVDAKTGKFLWRYDHTGEGSAANIPTPVVDASAIYSASGQGGAGLVKLTAKDGGLEAVEQYFSRNLPNAIGGSIKLGDYLYGTTPAGIACVNFLTGEIKWQDSTIRSAGALCFADGHFYIHYENGAVALVEATPDGYREKGNFAPPDQPTRGKGQAAWAYPVVANGRLYIRDLGMMWCYDVKKAK